MINQILKKIDGKNVAILGFGQEGKTTYNFIRRYKKEIPLTILDLQDIKEEKIKQDHYTNFITGKEYLTNLRKYDLIIKSPGISLNNKDVDKNKITSQMQLFLEVAKDNVIGITGTKGKSTTSSLIYEIIKKQNKNVFLIGNIGIPIFSIIEKFNKNSIYVMEMSSHQLEYLTVSPHISILLNLYEDHLDHAKTLKHYYECKMNIVRFQTKQDIMIYNSNNKALVKELQQGNFIGQKYSVNLIDTNADIYQKENFIYFHQIPIYDLNFERKIKGNHNLENIMFALLISQILKLKQEIVLLAIKNFESLPYRLEKVAEKKKVSYYVDVLATIPEATINSIETLKNVNTLIFGGLDRGINYQTLIDYLQKSTIENLICMPTTGHKIANQLYKKKIFLVNTLEEAVNIAKKVTKENMICLLSPAASSYEQFKNYKEKADKFIELISDQKN